MILGYSVYIPQTANVFNEDNSNLCGIWLDLPEDKEKREEFLSLILESRSLTFQLDDEETEKDFVDVVLRCFRR